MNFNSLSSPRIIEERKRLGLNQAEAGVSCGVSREMWGKYERGIATVSSEVLYLFAQLGADVQYILTGVRSSLALSPDERFLLERWRGSSQERKDAALGALIGAAGNAEFVVKGDVGQQVKVAGNFSQDNVSFLGAASAKDKSK